MYIYTYIQLRISSATKPMKRGTDARASTEIDASTGVQYIFVRFRAQTSPKKLTWNDLQPSYGSENAENR